jgi:hypothetical protein
MPALHNPVSLVHRRAEMVLSGLPDRHRHSFRNIS